MSRIQLSKLAHDAARNLAGRDASVALPDLSPAERAKVAETVAKKLGDRPLPEVIAELLPLWAEDTVQRGRAAGRVMSGDYRPVHVETPAVVRENDRTKKPGGWADPEHVPRAELEKRLTYEGGGQLRFDAYGKPMNPAGPTGKTGRVLGKWGPNHAADPIIVRKNPETGDREMLAIRRKDTGEWAIPGGMVDDGEAISSTLARELHEETGVLLDMSTALPVYRGIVKDDPRNTDNAWMETNVSLKVLNAEEAAKLQPTAGDDATQVQWMPLTAENIAGLYASHGDFVTRALSLLEVNDITVRRAGGAEAVATLAPELQALPRPLQLLCVELDGLWGNADGKVNVEEIDRVARYVLSALPFFTKEADALLQLADALGYTKPGTQPGTGPSTAPSSLLALRLGVGSLEPGTAEKAAPFRALFDEAVALAATVGGPELIRDVAHHQPKWHQLSILEHMAKAVEAVTALADRASLDWTPAGAVMLLHDVGKLIERSPAPGDDGREGWHFQGHEEVGAQWLAARGLDPELVFHVRTHGDIRHKSVDDILALCEHDPARVQQFVLIALADTLAKGDTAELKTSAVAICAKVEELCARAGGESAGLHGPQLTAAYVSLREAWFSGPGPGEEASSTG